MKRQLPYFGARGITSAVRLSTGEHNVRRRCVLPF